MDILVAEDNHDHLELIVQALNEQLGPECRIAVAGDGQQALDYLYRKGMHAADSSHFLPDLILLDLNMPKVDGRDVLKAVKEDAELRTIPVVVLTTSTHDRDIAESYRSGTNSYIVKPVMFDELRKVIRDITGYWAATNTGP